MYRSSVRSRKGNGWGRRLAFGLPIVLTSTLIGLPVQPQVATAAPAASKCPASAADESAALIDARLCGGNVAIDDATSETSTAVARPDGQVRQTVSAAPVRVEQNGQWVPVDLTLVRNADGTVSPRAATTGLVISGAHNTADAHPLATVGAGAQRVSLSWAGQLGQPALNGDRATYAEVKPGVDLVVQATRTGSETFFVVKTRAAAKQVADLRLPVTGAGVKSYRADPAGNVTLLDAGGKPIATSPEPTMWDAQVSPDTGQPVNVRTVKARVSARPARLAKPKAPGDGAGAQLALAPDQAFFTDPATRYPVTIDPQLNPVSTTFDTYVRQNDTADHSGANDLELGIANGVVDRSFLAWDTTRLSGKSVTSATVYFWNWWSGSCTASSWELWTTGAAGTDTRWSNQPAWSNKEATSTATKGGTGCTDGSVSIDGKNFFQRAATAGQSRGYMGLRATSETNGDSFKQFRSRSASDSTQVPYAVVNYNSYPTVGARSTTPASSCVTGSGRPYLNSATPALKAVVNDADGNAVKGVFEWYTTAGTKIGGATTGAAAAGSTISTTVPSGALANGSSYKWRVQANDGSLTGAWTSYCEFTVDTTGPTAAPTVLSATYPPNTTGGNVGVAGTFGFGANGVSDVAAFLYGLDTNPPATAVNATSVGGSATVSITPATAGPHTLYVRSRDRAGNLSGITSYAFTVDSIFGSLTAPKTGDLSPGKSVVSSSGAATSTGVTYQWRRGDTDAWTTIPAADVVTANGGAAVTWPLATTGGGTFPDVVWNAASTVNSAEPGPDALDGPLQVRASFAGGTAGTSAATRFELDRNRAEAPTFDVGAGVVNLLTGNLTVTDNDAQASGGLGLSRSYNTRQAGIVDPLFGPGWVSSATVATADTYRNLVVTGNLAQVGTPDGDTLNFTKSAVTSTGASFAPQIGDEDLGLEYVSASDQYRLTDSDSDVTTFTRRSTDPAGTYAPESAVATGTGDKTVISSESVTVNGTNTVRPIQVLAPTPDGVDCSANPASVRGCKVITYAYATSTTATSATAGDFAGRLRQISFTAYDPDASAMRTVAVAAYSYDANGRLAAAWDPRLDYTDGSGSHHLATKYTYNADGILDTITDPGREPWRIAYTTTPGDAGKGRLLSVSSSALSAGTATTTMVYSVPLSGPGAPGDLSAAQIARWGQSVTPVDATAVFPPTQVPDGNPATGALPSSWRQAVVTYLDGNAREVDTRQPGGHINSTWYDTYGNIVRSLSAGNLERALNASSTDTPATEAALAATLSVLTQYSADGQDVLDELGPEHDVRLTGGSVVRGRSHTVNHYDEGAPDTSQTYNLLTSATDSIRYWTGSGAAADADGRTTSTQYDWSLRQPTATIVDPQGLKLVTRTDYDSSTGLATATTSPAGDGTTAATSTTVYYRAGTGSGYSECDGHPEFANLPCRTATAAQPDSDPEVPATFAQYNMYAEPTATVEKDSAGTLRTTTATYDSAGRPVTSAVAANPSLGTPIDARRKVYDPATGDLIRTEVVDGSGKVTAHVDEAYDGLGRVSSYTDASGSVTTTTYDVGSRPQTIDDGKGTRTLTYDDAVDGRGLLTKVVDSQAGTFAGSYDADGFLTTENRSDGLTVNHTYDEEHNAVGLSYLRGSDTVYTDQVGLGVDDQWQVHSGSLGKADYGYDAAGRLTTADQTVGAGGCVTRRYAYDDDSNRAGLTSYAPAADGTCQTATTGSHRTWAYDAADRVAGAGYGYDDLGRTVTVPAADTAQPTSGDASFTYFGNDLAASITQGTDHTAYALDVLPGRYGSVSTASGTTSYHYGDDSDSPSWIDEAAGYSHVISGLSGLEAIFYSSPARLEWQIVDLHGDVVATEGADGILATYSYDEFGNAGSGSSPRYGYLGNAQRSAANTGGFITMGVRTYNPATGRFLSVDPVPGGSATNYDYAGQNPVTNLDLDGRKYKCKCSCHLAGSGPQCDGFALGEGEGKTQQEAAKNGQRDANNDVPRGCYKRHCNCKCTKSHIKQFFGGYSAKAVHADRPSNWDRKMHHWTCGLFGRGTAWADGYFNGRIGVVGVLLLVALDTSVVLV